MTEKVVYDYCWKQYYLKSHCWKGTVTTMKTLMRRPERTVMMEMKGTLLMRWVVKKKTVSMELTSKNE
jgi:hypothetical protein